VRIITLTFEPPTSMTSDFLLYARCLGRIPIGDKRILACHAVSRPAFFACGRELLAELATAPATAAAPFLGCKRTISCRPVAASRALP